MVAANCLSELDLLILGRSIVSLTNVGVGCGEIYIIYSVGSLQKVTSLCMCSAYLQLIHTKFDSEKARTARDICSTTASDMYCRIL